MGTEGKAREKSPPVPEQRQSDAMIRRLASVVENADDAILTKDVTGVVTSWNKGAERLYGYTEQEIVGKPVAILAPPGHEDEPLDLVRRIISARQVIHTETIRVRKDGTPVNVSLTLSPVLDASGAVTEVSTVARDITGRIRVQQALEERTRQLELSNKELLQFAYVASHDLQEPLRKVASFCQLLARRYQGRLDEDADEYIGYVVDGAKRMQQLIEDLLTFSRVGRSAAEQVVAVDCGEIMRRVLQDLSTVIADTGAEVVVTGELPTVRANTTLLVQLFENLVSNAIKFRGSEPPRVAVSAVRAGQDWQFAIADNGIGIEPQYAGRVFAVFQRLHSRTEYQGTGIGLAVCKKIVETYGGRIWLESRPGAGTTFYWTMPAAGEKRP